MFTTIQTLAVADLSVNIHSSIYLLRMIVGIPELPNAIIRSLRTVTLYSSAYHLILVAMERSYAIDIVLPLRYRMKATSKQVRIASCVVWFLAAVTCIGDPFLSLGLEITGMYISPNVWKLGQFAPIVAAHTYISERHAMFAVWEDYIYSS